MAHQEKQPQHSEESVGLALLEPELLVHALLFIDHLEAVRTASACTALRDLLLGTSHPDTAYLWRCLFRRRWLFGLRRRHRAPAAATSGPAAMQGGDFWAYRARHEQARRMGQGRAGQFHVRTVRPPEPSSAFTASLHESEEEGEEEAKAAGGGVVEGPVAYLGMNEGLVMRVGYGPSSEGGEEQIFHPLWQSAPLPPASPITALAREGDALACGCGAFNGRVFFLHAGTGKPLQYGSGGAAVAAPIIDTGFPSVDSLLWLEGGRRLAVAARMALQVKLYCPRTGLLCQEIAFQLPPALDLPYSVLVLLRRSEKKEEGGAAAGNGSSRRPHFLVLHNTQACFFVQDTAAETPQADAALDGFRPYSQHGQASSGPESIFTQAAFAPAVGGLPHDEEAGAYRVFLGTRGAGVKTATFFVHPRIRLAQLLQAGGEGGAGPIAPLHSCGMAEGFVESLQVRSIPVNGQRKGNGAGSDRALLVAAGYSGGTCRLFALHIQASPSLGDGQGSGLDYSIAMMHACSGPVAPVVALYIDAEKMLAVRPGGVDVLAVPRDPPPLPMVPDKSEAPRAPIWGRHLYTLSSGSATLPTMGMRMEGVAVGTAEVLVVHSDKLRLYDFSP